MTPVRHNIYDEAGFSHSVEVDGVEGPRVSYTEIARFETADGDLYCAVTDYYSGTFPEIFRAHPIKE